MQKAISIHIFQLKMELLSCGKFIRFIYFISIIPCYHLLSLALFCKD